METYKLSVGCKNCGDRREMEIEKGIPIDDAVCQNCGVVGQLHRRMEPIHMIPDIDDSR